MAKLGDVLEIGGDVFRVVQESDSDSIGATKNGGVVAWVHKQIWDEAARAKGLQDQLDAYINGSLQFADTVEGMTRKLRLRSVLKAGDDCPNHCSGSCESYPYRKATSPGALAGLNRLRCDKCGFILEVK